MAEVKYAIVNFQPTANQAAKAASKREQIQARLSYAERERFRPKVNQVKGMGHSCQTFQAHPRNVSATSTKRITHKNVTQHD